MLRSKGLIHLVYFEIEVIQITQEYCFHTGIRSHRSLSTDNPNHVIDIIYIHRKVCNKHRKVCKYWKNIIIILIERYRYILENY